MRATLQELLTKKKNRILDRWLNLVFDTYAQENIPLLKDQRDPFANPVGSTFRRELENLFDGLASGSQIEQMTHSLDAMIRVRAVQKFRPSEAVAFVIHVKKAIREELGDLQPDSEPANGLTLLESRVDELMLAAFDLYMACREKIAEIRVGEARAEKNRLLRVVRALGQSHGVRESAETEKTR